MIKTKLSLACLVLFFLLLSGFSYAQCAINAKVTDSLNAPGQPGIINNP